MQQACRLTAPAIVPLDGWAGGSSQPVSGTV